MADAGILFPAIPAGIPITADPDGILFPADLAEPDTVGVADLADAGILFPTVPAGILIPADPAGILFPADLTELVTIGVADVAVAGWRQWMEFPYTTVVIMTILIMRTPGMKGRQWICGWDSHILRW